MNSVWIFVFMSIKPSLKNCCLSTSPRLAMDWIHQRMFEEKRFLACMSATPKGSSTRHNCALIKIQKCLETLHTVQPQSSESGKAFLSTRFLYVSVELCILGYVSFQSLSNAFSVWAIVSIQFSSSLSTMLSFAMIILFKEEVLYFFANFYAWFPSLSLLLVHQRVLYLSLVLACRQKRAFRVSSVKKEHLNVTFKEQWTKSLVHERCFEGAWCLSYCINSLI